jgi:diaminopimelate epimerase
MTIPYYKAHGAGNDFLLTFAGDVGQADFPALARAICHRNLGVGGDGWYLIDPRTEDADARIRLWNSDGSYAELSGNGTRCVAALLVHLGFASRGAVRIQTGAGIKELQFLRKDENGYWFDMNMGIPRVEKRKFFLLGHDVTIVDVGNPQCAVPVATLKFDWRRLGARIEADPHFPKRTNVSFFTTIDDHTIDARFYERGAGPTLSSGTGATGAAVAAILRGLVSTPVTIRGEYLPLGLRWPSRTGSKRPRKGQGPVYLRGTARIVSRGEFYW